MAKKTSLADAERPMGSDRPRSMEELIKTVQGDAFVSPEETQKLPIDKLKRSRYQPRRPVTDEKADTALAELANSIRAVGLIEPIAVRPLLTQRGEYEILAGDRRWRAARLAGLTDVPVIVHVVDDVTAAAMALVENLQRQDLNAMDEALAMQRLVGDFELSQVQLSKMLGKSKSLISKTLGLLSLAEEVQHLVKTDQLDTGHARILINLDEETQIHLARRATKEGWSVRELEKQKASLVEQVSHENVNSSINQHLKMDPNIKHLEVQIGEWLAAPVKLRTQKNGGGSLIIKFTSTEECDGILEKMGFLSKED